MPRAHPLRRASFPLLALCVLATALWISSRLATLDRPELLALGVTLDLTLLLPGAFYLLVARPRRWSPLCVVPVAFAAALVAGAILPADHHGPLAALELVLVPLELGLLAALLLRVGRALGSADDDAKDPLARLREAAGELLPARRPAAVLASELALVHYGLLAWRARPHVPRGARAVGVHRRSNQAAIVGAVVPLVLGETFALHLLLERVSVPLAWSATAIGLYGLAWLVADLRATMLRPLLVTASHLHLRAGLRWSGRIPRGQIARVLRRAPADAGPVLSTTLLVAPTRWIVLHRPAVLEGPYGLRREARVLALAPDVPEVLDGLVEG